MHSVPESDVTRISLLRHYTTALDVGGLLAALARYRVTDREPLYALRARQQSQLVDLLHEFCYNARRAIELADGFVPDTIGHAQSMTIPDFGESQMRLGFGEESVPLPDKSLWWVLGRVIHSRTLEIRECEDAEVGTRWAVAPHITVYWSPSVVAVRSDKDPENRLHYVPIERLVELFLSLSEKFDRALTAARATS